MRPAETPFRRRLATPLSGVACALAILLSGACRDSPTDPVALMVDEETRQALSGESGLPSLTSVGERAREGDPGISAARLDRWSGAWQASWLAAPDEGARARSRIYERAAGPLARALGAEGVRETVDGTGRVVATVWGADLSGLPERYRERTRRARARIVAAREALEEGRDAEALRGALEAGDLLRAVSPRIVARSMVERAEEARRRIPEISTYSKREKERIARLVRNARHALETGEPGLAIQRAFYACQLLGLEPF